MIKLREFLGFRQDLGTVRSENLEIVVDFKSLVQNAGQNITTTGAPMDLGSARCLGFANLLVAFEAVDVHFPFGDVSETTKDHGTVEGTDPHRVSEPLGKLENGLAIGVVHGGGAGLLAGEHYELRAVACPGDVLHLVVEDGDEGTVLALVDPYELEGVLTVVAFAGRVIKILCPHKYGLPRRGRQNLYILRLWACNVKLWPLQVAVQIIYIHQSVVFLLREHLTILPGHEIKWRSS